MNKNKQLLYSIIAVVAVIFLVAGGTFAWWTWTSANNTVVNFTISGGNMFLDGGGNITGQKLVPTADCQGTYAIKRTVTLYSKNETATSMTGTITLNGIPTSIAKNGNLKYIWSTTEITSKTACSSATTNSFSKTATTADLQTFTVPANDTFGTSSSKKTYYLYIWLDSAETDSTTQGQSFNMYLTGQLVQNAT